MTISSDSAPKRACVQVLTAVMILLITTHCLFIPRVGVAEPVYVQVASTTLRAEPKHWAKAILTLRYGDSMTVLQEQEAVVPGWLQVHVRSKTGYVHSSSVTEKRVIVKGSEKGKIPAIASSDVVLAGKGFNEELEKLFRARGTTTDYRALDRMMTLRVSDQELKTFIQEGKLEGGAE